MAGNVVVDLKVDTRLPRAEKAKELLELLKKHSEPILRRRGWQILRLEEMTNSMIMGRCRINGNRNTNTTATVIWIRLRQGIGSSQFRDFRGLMASMLHEITHIKIMDHSRDFRKLENELREEYGYPPTKEYLEMFKPDSSSVQPRSLPSPSSSTEVCIFNTRHGKQLSTPNGSDVQVQERQARDNTAWRILPCPHEPGTSYIIDLKQQKFLDTPQGEGVSLWNNGGRDIEMIIDQNTSRFARNLRWHITACPHEPGTFYIINAGYGKFLDTNGEKVWLWNNNGKSVDTVVAENTSRFAGNLRWILRPVQ